MRGGDVRGGGVRAGGVRGGGMKGGSVRGGGVRGGGGDVCFFPGPAVPVGGEPHGAERGEQHQPGL